MEQGNLKRNNNSERDYSKLIDGFNFQKNLYRPNIKEIIVYNLVNSYIRK